MKFYSILCLIVAAILLLTPLAAISHEEKTTEPESISEDSSVLTSDASDDVITVFMTQDNTTHNMSMRDYIIGAVSAEMPASYSDEALKAQALAAVTFAQYIKTNGKSDDLKGADISDDSAQHQGYMTTSEMKEKWGDAFDEYYKKIEKNVDAVLGKIITYDGKPIMAAYCAISSGTTESALNIWGKDVPYLQSVNSEWDKDSPRFDSSLSVTQAEIKEKLKDEKGIDYDVPEGELIEITENSSAGTVLKVKVGGKEYSGLDLRGLLELRSPTYSVKYEDGKYTFDVKGYGHGVGMSQYGADCLAKEGKTCDEIIKHYYKGVTIENR